MLKVFDKNLVPIGVLPSADEVERVRRVNSDYELSFILPLSSDDFKLAVPKAHVQDERGQFYVINDRSRKRDGGQRRLVKYECTHVMFKLDDFKFPYTDYVDEAYGVPITTPLQKISAATGGKFTFSVDDTFDPIDLKDFGRGTCLQAFQMIVEKYGAEVEPDNFTIHLKKSIGMDRGYQARIGKNIQNITFRDMSRTLVTRMFSQMKDGRTFIGMDASNLTTEEYGLLNAVPGAIVDGKLAVNYLISPYVGYWSNTTNTYFDGEYIDQDIEDPIALLKATRKALKEKEVPAIDVSLDTIDLRRIDPSEPVVELGDTIHMYDPDMQINDITARVMELHEPLFTKKKHPSFTLSNFYLKDERDILADFDKASKTIDRILTGGKVNTAYFENFAAQAIFDINNSKTEISFPPDGGILMQEKTNPLEQVRLTSRGIGVSTDGWHTVDSALTAKGLVAAKVYGTLGNFMDIEIGEGNNVFKAGQSGIFAGNQLFDEAPFSVDMHGHLYAEEAEIHGTIYATNGVFTGEVHGVNGSFTGDFDVFGTLKGGKIEGAEISGATINGGDINVTSTVFIGEELHFQGHGDKSIRFDGSSHINLFEDSGMDIGANQFISLTTGLVQVSAPNGMELNDKPVATQTWVTDQLTAVKSKFA